MEVVIDPKHGVLVGLLLAVLLQSLNDVVGFPLGVCGDDESVE